VHADDVDALAAQALDQPVDAALGAHEDEREVAVAAQLAEQRLDALVALDGEEAVLDRGRARHGRRVLVAARVVREGLGHPAGLAVQRG
jgi:ribosomal protein L18